MPDAKDYSFESTVKEALASLQSDLKRLEQKVDRNEEKRLAAIETLKDELKKADVIAAETLRLADKERYAEITELKIEMATQRVKMAFIGTVAALLTSGLLTGIVELVSRPR